MKLKAKTRNPIRYEVELSWIDPAEPNRAAPVAQCVRVTPAQDAELIERHTVKGRRSTEEPTNWRAVERERATTYVQSIAGLTRGMLESRIDLDEDSEVDTDENGAMVSTPELIEFLWMDVPSREFRDVVLQQNAQILQVIAKEKARQHRD